MLTMVKEINGEKKLVHNWGCEDCGKRIEVISGTGQYTKGYEHMENCPNKD